MDYLLYVVHLLGCAVSNLMVQFTTNPGRKDGHFTGGNFTGSFWIARTWSLLESSRRVLSLVRVLIAAGKSLREFEDMFSVCKTYVVHTNQKQQQ